MAAGAILPGTPITDLRSVIMPSRQHLLLRGVQVQRVFVLRNVGSAGVTEGRIRAHDTLVHKVPEGHDVLGLSNAI
jgi:hypothetical protein